MPEAARIGPNAVLQMLPVLEAAGGTELRDRLLAAAGLPAPPRDDAMMEEGPAVALHAALRSSRADAPALARQAGIATGRYILMNRIPRAARVALPILPARLAARLLAGAIARHAWTFAGSGRFRIAARRPLAFEIAANPLARPVGASGPVCDWHVGVFDTLFGTLVDPRIRFVETTCCATGAVACRFTVSGL